MIALHTLNPNRIALIKPSALGDIIHSLPVLSALRQRWPNAHIRWVINRAYESLVAGHPDLDATLAFDRAALKRGPVSMALTSLKFMRRLREKQFDLVIDLQGLLRTGLMTWATGAERRIGFANAREGATRFYTDCIDVPDADDIHAVDRYWRIVEALGAGDAQKKFVVPISRNAREQADELLHGMPRPWVMMAAGARWITKRWPVANFAALAQHAQTRFGGSTIFIGGREDRRLSEVAARQLRQPASNLCGQTSLPVLAAVLERADVVIANDTGPLHLAAALGRPVVAPYTCTLVRKHGPYGQFNRTAAASISCHGSYLRTCDHMSCMPTLPTERLMPLLDKILSTWAIRQSGLILASGSPARRELLARLGVPFEVIPAEIEEPLQAGTGDARSYVATIAWMKAAAVAKQVDSGIVIAADTVGWLDGQPVLKPADETDARRILTSLAGREHELWTGMVLWRRPDDLQITWQKVSRVTMSPLSAWNIDEYLQTRQWVGCSGAYAIREAGDPLLSVVGSVTNVIGLPMESLARYLPLLN